MFFEAHHSTEKNYFHLSSNSPEKDFPMHIHRAFECYSVISGGASAIIDGEKYELLPGEAVLVFPYQRHAYITSPGSSIWVCIFSPDLVCSFNKEGAALPTSNKFLFSPDDSEPDGILMKKAMCYGICGVFDKGREYVEKSGGEEDLLTKILIYISKNYTLSCTLSDVANHVGYDYSYISKFFKKMMGMSFNNYVNGLRIDKAQRLLLSEAGSICEVAESCGFSCTRTFNREFLKITKKTPREFIKDCGDAGERNYAEI